MNKSLLMIALLSVSFVTQAAQAPAQVVKSHAIGNTRITAASGVQIFAPNSSWVSDTHLEHLTLAIPADASLKPAGGLNGGAHKAAGPAMAVACAALIAANNGNDYEIGTAGSTESFDLAEKGIARVLHVAAPRCSYYEGNEAEQNSRLLTSYANIIRIAAASQSRAVLTVLFGTGVGGYTPERSAKILAQAVNDSQSTSSVEAVYVICPTEDMVNTAVKALVDFSTEDAAHRLAESVVE